MSPRTATATPWALVALLLAGAAPLPARAAADGGEVESVADEGQFTSQVASFAVTKLKDSPAVVTVVTSEEIKSSGARDLIDVLSLVPGFFFGVDTAGVVGAGFRGLWGYEGKILLMIDGKEMNELLYSTVQLGNEFPTELIERVEVVRGPGSVIYGGNAELAVINVITRGVQGATDLQVSGTYGQMTGGSDFAQSYGRRNLSLSGRYVFDQVPGLSAFASASVGQGQRSVRPYVDNSGASAPGMGNTALNPTVVQAGVAYRDLQATFLYHRLDTSTNAGTGDVTTTTPASFDSVHGEVVATFRPTDRIEIVPRLNAVFQRPWTTSDQTSTQFYDKWVRRLRARLLARWAPLDALQVTAGLDAMFDTAWLNGPAGVGQQTSFNGQGRVDYRTIGGFLELYSENPIVNVSAGARYDNNSAVGGALVPRLVLLRSLGPVNLKALFSLAFRAPGVENINLGPVPPDGLRPERTTVFEFEASWDILKGMRLSANAFTIGIDSPIAYNVDPVTNVEGYKNLGQQGTSGFELGYRARGDWGRVDLNYSFYVPTLSEGITTYLVPGQSDRFLGAPSHRASIAGTWQALRWLSVSPTLLVLGPRSYFGPTALDGTQPVAELPTQVLANLFVRVEDVPVKGLSFGLGLYNIFGVDYRFPQPYHQPTGGYAPLPGLDREVLLRVTYLFEPAGA
jgi:outer membrane receptor protein involved in Fe transport